MAWQGWRSIIASSGHDGAAVYQLRLTDANGNPISISRFLSTDDRGILNIGESQYMETRRRAFVTATETCTGHSAGNLLYYLLKFSRYVKCFPNHQIEYRFRAQADKASARLAEERFKGK